MRKKLLVLLVCMLMIVSTMMIIKPKNLDVKADGGGSVRDTGDRAEINTSYIRTIAQSLSQIIFYPQFYKGRSFGSPGEHAAAQYIETWMDQIGLYNVHTEPINGTTQHPENQ